LIRYSFLIATKNRAKDLLITLNKLESLISRDDVECLIMNDGSTDETENIIKKFPHSKLFSNITSKGYIYSRNFLLNRSKGDFAISLDDDAHFLTQEPLKLIENYFRNNPLCGLISCRIIWSSKNEKFVISDEVPEKVKSFVGCGHIWRLSAWNLVPNYPEWYEFYGEEDYASFQLFKNGWEVHYVPDIFVHHRVNLTKRKKQSDFYKRVRQNFNSGIFNISIFYPFPFSIKFLVYTFYIQLTNKLFKGHLKTFLYILFAYFDLVKNIFRIKNERVNSLSMKEFIEYKKLANAKIYWENKSK
jgi:glycosyltransferase involved in cell wall biosynthesis